MVCYIVVVFINNSFCLFFLNVVNLISLFCLEESFSHPFFLYPFFTRKQYANVTYVYVYSCGFTVYFFKCYFSVGPVTYFLADSLKFYYFHGLVLFWDTCHWVLSFCLKVGLVGSFSGPFLVANSTCYTSLLIPSLY